MTFIQNGRVYMATVPDQDLFSGPSQLVPRHKLYVFKSAPQGMGWQGGGGAKEGEGAAPTPPCAGPEGAKV